MIKNVKRQSTSKIDTILIKNQVLACAPMNEENFDSNQFRNGNLSLHPKKTILKS
jgi:hypothetical protein